MLVYNKKSDCNSMQCNSSIKNGTVYFGLISGIHLHPLPIPDLFRMNAPMGCNCTDIVCKYC